MDYVAILNAYADKIGVTTVVVVVVMLVITYSYTTNNVVTSHNNKEENNEVTPTIAAASSLVELARAEAEATTLTIQQTADVQEPVNQALTISEGKLITESAPVRNYDTFITSLCDEGITVKLIKGETSGITEKDKIIKLNGDGELYWSAKNSAIAKKVRQSLTGKKDVIEAVIDIVKVYISPEVESVVLIQSKNAERSIKFSCKDQEEAKYYNDGIAELVSRVKAEPNYCGTLVTSKTPVKPNQDHKTVGATEAEAPVSKALVFEEVKDSN